MEGVSKGRCRCVDVLRVRPVTPGCDSFNARGISPAWLQGLIAPGLFGCGPRINRNMRETKCIRGCREKGILTKRFYGLRTSFLAAQRPLRAPLLQLTLDTTIELSVGLSEDGWSVSVLLGPTSNSGYRASTV